MPTFTTEHYTILADFIRTIPAYKLPLSRKDLATELAKLLAEDNERFTKDHFIAATTK